MFNASKVQFSFHYLPFYPLFLFISCSNIQITGVFRYYLHRFFFIIQPLSLTLPLAGRVRERGLGSLVNTFFVCFCSLESLHVQCPGVCKCWLGEVANAGSLACFSNTLQRYDGVRARLILIGTYRYLVKRPSSTLSMYA